MQAVKAPWSLIFLLLHGIKGDTTYFENALALCSSLNIEETHILCCRSYFFPREGGEGWRMHHLSSFYLVVALRRDLAPIFMTSTWLLAARCAETPDGNIYSWRDFNRLREIWVEYMKAVSFTLQLGKPQKLTAVWNSCYSQEKAESCSGTESSTTELEE